MQSKIEFVQELGKIPCSVIGDAMGRQNVLPAAISSVWKGARIAGQALTIETAPGDNAPLHEALGRVQSGNVIVVDGRGEEDRALMGELIAGRYKAAGAVGFVINGAVRDVEELEELQFPVFARSVTPAGPFRKASGSVGSTIIIGGVHVAPGDFIFGDADGVVVVPFSEAEEVLARAQNKHAVEEKERQRIQDLLSKA